MAEIDGPSICMGVTNRYVNPLDLQVEDIDARDIAHHLGNQCRYSGATREFYSVAQHSVLCARYLEAEGEPLTHVFTALLHDAAEAYLQDVARPLKEDEYFGKAYRGAENRAEKIIAEAIPHIIYPFPACVKKADLVLLATERRDIMPRRGKWLILEGVYRLPETVVPWSPKKARTTFLKEYERLSEQLLLKEVA